MSAIKEERVDGSGIDWNHFTPEDEVQFQNDQEKKLNLANGSQTTLYGEPAIRFEITKEDGKWRVILSLTDWAEVGVIE